MGSIDLVGEKVARADRERLIDPATVRRLEAELGRDGAERVSRAFAAEMERRLQPLEAAIEQADLGALSKLLHSIKGSALTFGATPLAEAARRGDDACRSGDGDLAIMAARTVHGLMPVTTRAILMTRND